MATSPRSDRWVRIEHLFYAALELEPDSRPLFLDQACRDDAELRKEVESCFRWIARPWVPPKTCPGRGATDHCKRGALRQTHRRLSVVARAREGGMGKVYLAARADDLYRKEVAIKTVQAGLDRTGRCCCASAVNGRSRESRSPAIARLLDGGITDDGLPYLVMEYVNGIRVDDYCRINKLGTEQRLQLFCAVCSAVEYAHKNLVVHRDIKPANILVTAEAFPNCWISVLLSCSTPRADNLPRREPPSG